MDDKTIIEMFFRRDQQAIAEAKEKYGTFCRSIAQRLLCDIRDAEECVNDTFLAAWDNIPPHTPKNLATYLGRIVRNKAVSTLRGNTAAKRGGGLDVLLSELEECLADSTLVEDHVESAEATNFINAWLYSLKEADRAIFILRYWHGYNPKEIAQRAHTSPAHISRKLFRLRQNLKRALETQGVKI